MNKDLILREKLALQRTIMANQTTLLAFIRTAMYFLVAGISVNNLTTIRHGETIEIVFVFIAFFLVISGIFNFSYQNRKIRNSEKHIGDFKLEYLSE